MDRRWDAGIKDGGGPPESSAMEGHSLDVDQRS
jgi:hypothetical protein